MGVATNTLSWHGPPDYDIRRTGAWNYDLTWEPCTEFDARNLEHMPPADMHRPEGHCCVILTQEEGDVVHDNE
ncbi:MAG: hypothetical protein E3J55_02840 [Dehalococcoidia bacterium]|nr:MAG: hypothetical protein E3J55_02840 [Dehalococcoidia bacterium]